MGGGSDREARCSTTLFNCELMEYICCGGEMKFCNTSSLGRVQSDDVECGV